MNQQNSRRAGVTSNRLIRNENVHRFREYGIDREGDPMYLSGDDTLMLPRCFEHR